MLFSAFIRKRLALFGLPCLFVFILFAISSGMQACGDFELWAEKSESSGSDDDDDDDDDDDTVGCETPFSELAAFDGSSANVLSSSLGQPVAIAVVPNGMSFSFKESLSELLQRPHSLSPS